MRMYEITKDFYQLQELIESLPDEKPEELEQKLQEALNAVQCRIEDKAKSLCYLIKNAGNNIQLIKDEKKRLDSLKKQAENEEKRFKDLLLWFMTSTEKTKLDLGTLKISIRNNPEGLEVVDIESVDPAFIKISKEARLKDLKSEWKNSGIVPAGTKVKPSTKSLMIK
jgi:hypothetical protein